MNKAPQVHYAAFAEAEMDAAAERVREFQADRDKDDQRLIAWA